MLENKPLDWLEQELMDTRAKISKNEEEGHGLNRYEYALITAIRKKKTKKAQGKRTVINLNNVIPE